MAFFNRFPYTNFHELNLDWILERLKELTGTNLVKTVNNESADSNGNISLDASDIPNAILSVNSKAPDSDGNVNVGTVRSICGATPNSAGEISAVRTLNGNAPDASGDVEAIQTICNVLPDSSGNINAVLSVNSSGPDGNGNVNVGTVKTVNNTAPDGTGNVNLPTVAGVTSVNNVGADGNGNVQLTPADLGAVSTNDVEFKIYNSITDIGLTSPVQLSTAYSALPGVNAMLICYANEFSGYVPSVNGTVVIIKRAAQRGVILFFGKESSDDDYRMYLTNDNNPDSVLGWVKIPRETYLPNEAYTANNKLLLSGIVTGGTKNLFFTLFLPKLLTNVSTISVSSMTGSLRGVNGYLNSDSSNIDMVNTYTVTAESAGENCVRIGVASSTAFTNTLNNTPAYFWGNLTLEFS